MCTQQPIPLNLPFKVQRLKVMWFVCVGPMAQSVVYVSGCPLRWKPQWPSMGLKSRFKFESCAPRRKALKDKGKGKGKSHVGHIFQPGVSNPASVGIVSASEGG